VVSFTISSPLPGKQPLVELNRRKTSRNTDAEEKGEGSEVRKRQKYKKIRNRRGRC
jgi:hypothetical protein